MPSPAIAMPSSVKRIAKSVKTPSTSAPTISRRTRRKTPKAMPPSATSVPKKPNDLERHDREAGHQVEVQADQPVERVGRAARRRAARARPRSPSGRRAKLCAERRDERRGLVAVVDLVDDVARVGAQHAAEVRQLHPRDRDRHAVDDRARPARRKAGVLPALPHAADDVVPLGDLREQLRDLLGRVLQVGVERHDDVPRHVSEAGEDRLVLAEVVRELEDADAVRAPRAAQSFRIAREPSRLPSSTKRIS